MLRDYLETHPEPGTPAAELKAMPDDGELEIHQSPDKERYGSPEIEEDAGGVPLSYGKLTESYIKGEEAEEPGIGGATYPEPNPEELGTPKDPKQTPQPVSASFW